MIGVYIKTNEGVKKLADVRPPYVPPLRRGVSADFRDMVLLAATSDAAIRFLPPVRSTVFDIWHAV